MGTMEHLVRIGGIATCIVGFLSVVVVGRRFAKRGDRANAGKLALMTLLCVGISTATLLVLWLLH
jgi:hypothetical protein